MNRVCIFWATGYSIPLTDLWRTSVDNPTPDQRTATPTRSATTDPRQSVPPRPDDRVVILTIAITERHVLIRIFRTYATKRRLFLSGVTQIAWSSAQISHYGPVWRLLVPDPRGAGSGRPYSHRTCISRMTVSTCPGWEFRDLRLCDEDLSRRPRSATKEVQQARQPRPGPSAGHRAAWAAAPGDALWPRRPQQAENRGEPGMKPQPPHVDQRRPALLPREEGSP